MLSFILQYGSNFRSILAKMLLKKQLNSHYFYPFMPWGLSIFKPRTCILHHFAFLVWLPTRIFFKPNYPLLDPKIPFLNDYFALSCHETHGQKRFCLYNCCGCLCFLSRIQRQISPHLAAFCLAFSTKTHSILHQNALHLAAKRTAFCSKLPRNWCKWQSFQIKIHFAACTC